LEADFFNEGVDEVVLKLTCKNTPERQEDNVAAQIEYHRENEIPDHGSEPTA